MSRRNWTPAEDAELQALLAKGKTNAAIARLLDWPESSVYSRTDVLAGRAVPRRSDGGAALPRPVKTTRPCMCCQTPFQSDGPHNRLCCRCRRIEKSPFET